MGCCWTQRADKSPTKTNQIQTVQPDSNFKEKRQGRGRCWVLTKICAIFCYILRRCFCRGRSSSKVKPEEGQGHALEGSSSVGTGESATREGVSLSVKVHVRENEQVHDHVQTCKGDAISQQKVQAHRPGTPRQPALENQGLSYWCYSKCVEDVMIEVDGMGDSDTVHAGPVPTGDTSAELNRPSGDDEDPADSLQPRSQVPISLVIDADLISSEDPRTYLDHNAIFKLLTIEFDLRRQQVDSDGEDITPDSIFEILQAAFLHPNVAEFRVRIDNWRLYVHGLENVLPAQPIPHIRTKYPMKLTTLIVYCPGVTLAHLLIWQGFILSQTRLETLICNFDSVQWTFYERIIQKLKGSLRRLELYSIINHNGNIDDVQPFEWSVLSGCKHMSSLKIWSDIRYYGLRTVGLEDWEMRKLTEIELKYVDLGMSDIKYLLLESPRLRLITLQYFTPIPNPDTPLRSEEFLETVTSALSELQLHHLSFTDYKLPVNIQDGKDYVTSHTLGYSITWTTALDNSYEVIAFQRKGKVNFR